MRIFIAALLPPEVSTHIAEYIDSLRAHTNGVRWEKPEKLHITLKFLGNVRGNSISDLIYLLRDVAHNYAPFEMATTVIGGFPNLGKPRVLYLGLSGNDSLSRLCADLENGLEKLGFDKEMRRFIPHVTLGRVKKRFEVDGALPVPDKLSFKIDEIGVIESILNPKGSVYEPVFVHKLVNR